MKTPRNAAHEKLIKEIFRIYGARPEWRIWPNNTGVAYRNGRPIRYGLVGSADIIGITWRGIFVALEVKTGQARQTQQQLNFEQMVTNMRGIYRVIREIEDVKNIVESI